MLVKLSYLVNQGWGAWPRLNHTPDYLPSQIISASYIISLIAHLYYHSFSCSSLLPFCGTNTSDGTTRRICILIADNQQALRGQMLLVSWGVFYIKLEELSDFNSRAAKAGFGLISTVVARILRITLMIFIACQRTKNSENWGTFFSCARWATVVLFLCTVCSSTSCKCQYCDDHSWQILMGNCWY